MTGARWTAAVTSAVLVACSPQEAATTAETDTTPSTATTPATDFGETHGCTAGFWASRTSLWDEATDPNMENEGSLRPGNTVDQAFSWRSRGFAPFDAASASVADLREATVLDALRFTDAAGVEGAARAAVREMAAAYLNAAYEGMEFPYRRFATGENGNPSLVSLLTVALEAGDERQLRDLAARLRAVNDLGCPL